MESQSALSLDDVVVGLGSNLGIPRSQLASAVLRLTQLAPVRAVSALYETEPVGGPAQPNYLNAAVRLAFGGPLPELLRELLAIERGAGRVRAERWGPRTLDLDILWAQHRVWREPGLEVPHAHLRERAFALRPLLDVAPDARDPRDGTAYGDLARALGESGTVLLERHWISW
jgi:2-amino-4-hydroxy-6-hydroxymethyldihydropteridine diphosphokinase